MLDSPTTAFYHGPNQNVKSLFGAIPSGLPALVNLSFSSYFQPSSQQETRHPSIIETSSSTVSNDLNSAPTAPQQPTHSNRRTQRRVAQKQQNSVSPTKSCVVPQRVTVDNKMGNVNSPAAQSSKVPSMITTSPPSSSSSSSSTSSPSSSSHNNHHHHRRKKYSNKINRKKVDEAITLSAFAVEEDSQGNHDVAMEFYLSAIENMLEALPIHANQSRKDALKNKLRDFMDREGLTDDFMESTNASSAAKAIEREEGKSNDNDGNTGPGISDHIIQVAINSAVALKQSPIPDAISATVNYTMKKIQKIDETYGLQNKAWEISRSGINKALEIDQQYNVHQKVGNAFFVGIAAAMKAGIAYKDSPSYRELQRMQTEFQNAGTSNHLNIKGESSSS